jgi:predicted dehydrogenase
MRIQSTVCVGLAARHGRHVIVEKPLAIEWNQIRIAYKPAE